MFNGAQLFSEKYSFFIFKLYLAVNAGFLHVISALSHWFLFTILTSQTPLNPLWFSSKSKSKHPNCIVLSGLGSVKVCPSSYLTKIPKSSEWRFRWHSTESPLDNGCWGHIIQKCRPISHPLFLPRNLAFLAEFSGCHTERNKIDKDLTTLQMWRWMCQTLLFFSKMPAQRQPLRQQQSAKDKRQKRISVNEFAQVSACVNDVRLCWANDSDSPQRHRCC